MLLRALGACLLIAASSAPAQIYKYRDANGNLVYSEQKPDSKAAAETLTVNLEAKAPRIEVEQIVESGSWQFRATNECLCVAQFEIRIQGASHLVLPPNPLYRGTLQPKSQQTLARFSPDDTGEP